MIHSRITGTGGYLPERVLTNHELEKLVDTSDQWIRDRTGIAERYIAADNELTSDLALQASINAIKAAGISVDEIDLVIVATTSADQLFPNNAADGLHRIRGMGVGPIASRPAAGGAPFGHHAQRDPPPFQPLSAIPR